GAEVRVGVCLERTPDLVAALLAVWKAGAAYVPLDPAHPPLRLRAMLADAGAPLVVTTANLADALASDGVRALRIDADADAIAAEDGADPHPRPLPQTAGEGWDEADVSARGTGHGAPGNRHSSADTDPSHLAYVIFTSGSTGTPKGVEVEHGAISNLLDWMREAVTDEERAGVLASTNTTFDVSVAELFDTLCNGGRLVLAGNALDLIGLADAGAVRMGVMVPTAAAELLRAGALPPSLATLNLAGEALPAKLAEALHATGTVRTVRNLYGPTEATVYSTWETVEPRAEAVTIGRPAANTRAYVLDAKLNPAPVGVPGELYLAGAQVARGYGARPSLTAERFVPEPFGGHAGARMYRTGDRARWRADGRLEYLGRFDTQVKVRGHRVELGEVEHALLQHPAVHEAAAAVRDGRLLAWTVAAPGAEPTTSAALRAFLRERLPEPMVPSAFVAVDAFPTTSSGKVDRAALPDSSPDEAEVGASPSSDAVGDAAPASAVEEALARIWAQALRRERVGRDENFFELGGDSILSIQVILRAAKEGIRILPRHVFAHPTVAGLAAVAGTAPLVNADQGPVTGPAPLTPVQAWFLEQELPDAHHWNHAFVFTAAERLDPAVLASAVDAVLAHHDALRARFRRTDAGWTQEFAAPGGPIPLLTIDLSALPDDGLGAAIAEHGGHLQAGLELEQGPLFRAALFECGAHRPQRVLLAAHHLVVDVVSWRPIVEDLEAAYRAIVGGTDLHLPSKTTSYAHWAARLAEFARMPELRAELGWWRDAIPVLVPALPVNGEGPDVEGTADAVAIELDEEETRALLEDVPPVYGTQVNDALLAGLAQAFAAWAGRDELLVELEGHGREDLFEDVDASRTAGWFTAIYPVLLRAPADPGEALRSAKETLRAVPRRGIGYGMLRWIGEPADRAVLAARARPEVSFNYLGQVDAGDAESPAPPLLAASGEHPGATRSPRAPRRHRISVEGMTAGGRLRMAFHHSSAVYRPETVQRLADAYADALRAIIAHCRSGDVGGFTPSDFPEAGLDQAALDALMSRLG
ncbi:MAG: amino acid adenylation domain-containing protein, partial [Gemmatimonadetes bacterium]|nr:amino acid adenylation domain-containing protein [Gemmatimonadota bacterium]